MCTYSGLDNCVGHGGTFKAYQNLLPPYHILLNSYSLAYSYPLAVTFALDPQTMRAVYFEYVRSNINKGEMAIGGTGRLLIFLFLVGTARYPPYYQYTNFFGL